MAEAKVLADDHGARAQFVHQDPIDELPRRFARQLFVEGEDAHLLDAERLEPLEALLEGPEKPRRAVGREDLGGCGSNVTTVGAASRALASSTTSR